MTFTWRLSEKIIPLKHPPDFHYNKEYGIRGRASPNILELISQLVSRKGWIAESDNFFLFRSEYL